MNLFSCSSLLQLQFFNSTLPTLLSSAPTRPIPSKQYGSPHHLPMDGFVYFQPLALKLRESVAFGCIVLHLIGSLVGVPGSQPIFSITFTTTLLLLIGDVILYDIVTTYLVFNVSINNCKLNRQVSLQSTSIISSLIWIPT